MKPGVTHHRDRDRIPRSVNRLKVPGYRILELLDARRGVWSAEGPGGYTAALRFLPMPPGIDPDDFQEQTRDRASRHPNVQTTFSSWRDKTTLVLVTEMAYGSLWDRYLEIVKAGSPGIPRDELIEYLGRASRGLDYLNGHGPSYPGRPWTIDRNGQAVSHGDISPRTILFIGGAIKVTDMDPSRWAWDLTRAGDEMTSRWSANLSSLPRYAAPERFAGRSSRNSDQYSLALTYYRLRTGRVPFPCGCPVFVAGQPQRFVDLTFLPEAERAAVARALEPNPDRRWPSCSTFVENLCEDVLAARTPVPHPTLQVAATLPAFPPDDDRRPRPWLGRALTLPVAVAAGAATIAGAFWFQGGGVQPARAGRPSIPHRTDAGDTSLFTRLSPQAAEVRPEGSGIERVREGRRDAPPPAPDSPSSVLRRSLLATEPAGAETEPIEMETHSDGPPPIESSIVADEPAPATKEVTRVESAATGVVAGVAAGVTFPRDDPDAFAPAPTGLAVGNDQRADASPPPATGEGSIRLETPGLLSVQAGQAATLPVAVKSQGVRGPVQVRLEGLPRGLTAEPRTIGDVGGVAKDKDDATPRLTVEVRADATSVEGVTQARLVATAGPARCEETVRLTVLPSPAVAARRTGDAMLRRGELDRAITAYTEAVKRDPGDHLALHGRGLAAFNKGDYVNALTDFGASLGHQPGIPTARNNRGLARLALGDAAGAIADFDEAARSNPDDPVVRYNRGRAHAQAGANERAIADYDQAIRLDPKFAKAFKARADTLARTGDSDRNLGLALADYDTSLRLCPGDANTLNNRGLLRFAKGEHHRAIADFDEAIRIKPSYAVVHYNRGRVYSHMGDADEALASFQQALKLDPNLTCASRARSEIVARNSNPGRTPPSNGTTGRPDTRARPGRSLPANSALWRATASNPTPK